jgi:uncharacterized protein (DUF2267 family)
MQREEFLERVRERADLGSIGRAEEVTRATLVTLGEYLAGGEGNDLAAQLPRGIAEILRRQPPDRSMLFSLSDFLQRVGEQEQASPEEAEAHVRAVFAVLDEAVSGGEWSAVRRQFPSEFDPLFG